MTVAGFVERHGRNLETNHNPHDRAGANTFRITHVFLAQMLGVRRSGVTVAAGLLLDRKFIHYRHGVMQILDRRGLEPLACPYYRLFNGFHANHLRPTK